ncbi:MAG: carbamate kinase, partial [Hyphomicrobiales bacterium]|nr:carbamate kinase [Hyphomicrobiales bacterium]
PPEGICGLDVLGAQSQGMIGYMIEQEMRNALPPGRSCATLLTQVLVRMDDAAFQRFEKPVGPRYSQDAAQGLHRERGWQFVREGDCAHSPWRRVVPSPQPQEILGLETIRQLAGNGSVVVCLGGGGIPVAKSEDGHLHGVEAVIDKDHASALLAHGVEADALLLLTDVEGVMEGWKTPSERLLRELAPGMIDPATLEAGSMRPKVAAAFDFVQATGKPCAIGQMEEVAALLAGKAGTRITPER